MSKYINDIIQDYCEANGFDGLYNEDCGCLLNDLAPCEGIQLNCQPGYKYEDEDGWGISPEKEEIK